MAIDSEKIRGMMKGKTLNKQDIDRMCDMVRKAEDPHFQEDTRFFYE